MSTRNDQDIGAAANDHYASRFGEIGRLVRIRDRARDTDHDAWADDVDQRLNEMPLSVSLVTIRPHREECEWEILLGTGGPADRVLVTTDYRGEIESAEYQHQDWFTPWTWASDQDRELVEAFAASYYFGTVAVSIDGSEQ